MALVSRSFRSSRPRRRDRGVGGVKRATAESSLTAPRTTEPVGRCRQPLAQGTPTSGYRLSAVPSVHLALSDDEGELCAVVMGPGMAQHLGRLLIVVQPAGLRG